MYSAIFLYGLFMLFVNVLLRMSFMLLCYLSLSLLACSLVFLPCVDLWKKCRPLLHSLWILSYNVNRHLNCFTNYVYVPRNFLIFAIEKIE